MLPATVALGAICVLLAAEAATLRIGIDDLDEGYFVQQAARVLHGQVPYRDFQTLYTPGLLTLHALIFGALGGPFLIGPRVLALAARAGLALMLYVLTLPLVRQPWWAAVPGAFVLLCLDDAPQRWEPHPGWLSTLFAVVSAWCLGHRPTTRWLVGSGLAAGMAYLFKQNTGVFLLAAVLAWGVLSGRHDRARRVLVPLAAFVGVTGVWLGPLVVAIQGQLQELSGFVGAVNQAGLASEPEPSIGVPALCLLGGAWLAWQSHEDSRVRWYLLAGLALFGTQYPRMDTLHLAWSTPLLLVVGVVGLDRVRPAWGAVGMVFAAFLLTGPLLASRIDLVRLPKVPIADVPLASAVEAPLRTAADLQGVIADIQQRTQPGEPIFVYPTSPLLYALAERPNPTRFDHLNPGAASPAEIDGVIADLDAAHVRLVVISDYWRGAWGPPGPNGPLEAWLDGHFTEVARYGAYRVLQPGL